jgi:catechol 2,3-dioxygenase-like lactoylglutathione lyase family enzyme
MPASNATNVSTPPTFPVLRFARPTLSMEKMMHFYEDALGLTLIASFDDHEGFDGRILAPGKAAPWHLEFTYTRPSLLADTTDKGKSAFHFRWVVIVSSTSQEHVETVQAPTQDNLLVLYIPSPEEFAARQSRMESHGYAPVPAVNPYWDRFGITYEDPEGWRIVLCRMDWTAWNIQYCRWRVARFTVSLS